MSERRDIVDIEGLYDARPVGGTPRADGPKRFLSVWFRCCHAYGRLSRNRSGTAFVGRCPRCGAPVRARIGEGGTNRRLFEAR